MKTNAFAAGLFFFASLVIAGQPAQGFDPEAQVHGSDLIVTGEVVSVRPEQDELGYDSRNEAEVRIDQIWKGFAEADRIRVRTPGGALDDPGFALEGAGRFVPGEKVLLFLTRSGDTYQPWRMVFGKYTIRGTGSDASLTGDLPAVAADLTDSPVIALAELRQEVQVIVARQEQDDRLDVALHSPLR